MPHSARRMPARALDRSHTVSSFCSPSFFLQCSKCFEAPLGIARSEGLGRSHPKPPGLTALSSQSDELHVASLEVELYSKLDSAGLRRRRRADRGDCPDRRSIAD